MQNLGRRAGERWQGLGTAARLWWYGAGAVAIAALLAVAVTTVSDATATAPAGGTSAAAAGTNGTVTNGTTATSGTAMPAMPGMSQSGSAPPGGAGTSTGSGAAPASGTAAAAICPNIKGTTTMGDGMVMAPVPAGAPTASEQAAANALVAETTTSVSRYTTLAAATAAGYVPVTNPNGREVHYVNWQIVRSRDVLDPQHPSSLVYANTVKGPVLLGAMYLSGGSCQPGPDIGGPLTQWHAHDNLCIAAGRVVGTASGKSGQCTVGNHNTADYFMLHVWVAPSLAADHQFQPDLTRTELAPIIRTGQA
jgi:hypothetical protein